MKKLILLAVSAVFLAGCAHSTGKVNKQVISGYSDKMPNEARVVGDLKVEIVKKDDDWTKVKVHGKEGYMKTSMLAYSKNKDSGETTTENTETKNTRKKTSISTGDTMYIEKGIRLNLREAANSSSEVLGSFRGGTKVTILKKGNYWSRVEVKGQVGYMANEYLTD